MAVYAIGDLQGCYDEFQRLLDKLHFDPDQDRLWLTGDLVNRGPDSLKVLRQVRSLGNAAICVLGNHDLHLLARAAGVRESGKRDTLDAVLGAEDAQVLMDWLRHQPLLHHDNALGWTMVHAGLAPQWDLPTARACAAEVEAALRADDYQKFLAQLFKNRATQWHEGLDLTDRRHFAVNCLTRLRYCHPDGSLALGHSGAPGTQPKGQVPWFEVPGRQNEGMRVIFGHWSTLGPLTRPDLLALDGGCVWGGSLASARIDETPQRISWPCEGYRQPGRKG